MNLQPDGERDKWMGLFTLRIVGSLYKLLII